MFARLRSVRTVRRTKVLQPLVIWGQKGSRTGELGWTWHLVRA